MGLAFLIKALEKLTKSVAKVKFSTRAIKIMVKRLGVNQLIIVLPHSSVDV